jgi:hypothetical protein
MPYLHWNECVFSSETEKARRKWNISKVLKEKTCQPRLLNPGKIFFTNGGELKTFSDEGIRISHSFPTIVFQKNS